jgi:hypothetical protein
MSITPSISLALLVLVLAAGLLAQVTVNGTLAGTVLDPAAQAVAEAGMIVTRPATNFRETTVSDREGRFQLPGLQPGIYDIAVEKPGFPRLLRQGITLEVNRTVQLSLNMTARSGNAFDVQLGQDVDDDGAFNDRPALASGATLAGLRATAGLDKTQRLVPQTDARNLLVVPANVTDPFVTTRRNSKRLAVTERFAATLELNAFNLFNRANFAAPGGSVASALFGVVTRTITPPRQLQLGLKLAF